MSKKVTSEHWKTTGSNQYDQFHVLALLWPTFLFLWLWENPELNDAEAAAVGGASDAVEGAADVEGGADAP